MAYVNTSRQAERPTFGAISAFFRSLQDNWARYRVYRDTLKELERLSDRELDDLGLNALTIRQVAYEAAYAN